MKPTLLTLLALFLSLFACTNQQEETGHVYSGPKVVEAKGYVVPRDSMAEPKVITVDESKITRIPSRKSVMYPNSTNVKLAGKPKTVAAGTPRICTPGQDTFDLPEKLIVSISVSKIKYPESVKSKDPSFGDSNSGLFSTYSKMQGLNHNQIFSMIEDRQGNIWLGTEGAGVTKFDGRNFTPFTVENGLSHNNVMSMLEDKNGNIWLGHYDGLFDKYDGHTITHFQLPEGKRSIIRSFMEDNEGNIWFNSSVGVIKYDGISFFYFSYSQGLQLTGITSITKDKHGILWLGGARGGIARYDGKSFSHYGQEEGLSAEYVQSLLGDKTGNLWIGHESGVTKLDNFNFTYYTSNEGMPTGWIVKISEDHLGALWFCTSYNGIVKFDHTYFSHFTSLDGLEDNRMRSILTDKMHNLWIGTYGGGVSKYNPSHFTHHTTLEDFGINHASGMAKDTNGNIWFCHSKEGIVKYNGHHFEHFTDNDLSTTYNISDLVVDSENILWLAGSAGLAKFSNDEFTYFFNKDYSPLLAIRGLTADAKGNIWLSTWGKGATMFDGQKLIQFRTENGISSNYNNTIHCDKNGNIWIGSWEKGVTKIVPIELNNSIEYACTHYSEKEGLSQKSVYAIIDDHDGNLWFGTWGGGVNRFDGKYFSHITSKEGLINNFVYSILEDRNATIWLGTRLGLSQISNSVQENWFENDIASSEIDKNPGIKNYSFEDGFLGIGCKGLNEDNKGNIWVRTDDMITTFPIMDNIETTDSIAPNIQITSVKLFNEKIDWSDLVNTKDTSFIIGNGVKVGNFKYSGLSKWYSIPENLSLASNNNYLTFNFIGITQRKANKVMYKYLLEGNEQNWSALTPFTEAHYGNLPHGNYTFKVKAMNSEGFWSNEFHYPFTIRPPWWQTWWAYSLYALGSATLLWRLHKIQQARTIRIERERTQAKELAQAKEIEKAYTELKATQKQLIQSEKMASLGELTAGIAHEIQNPLNFVNNFSEMNSELIAEMKIEMDRQNLNDAKSLADTIDENEQKILFHGKRADAIVKGMLQHSRAGSGVKEPTDINALADEYLRLAYHGLRAKDKSFNATMKTDFDDTIGLVNVIPQDIGRVILNLITNAFYAVSERQKSLQTPYPLEGGVEYMPTITVKTQKHLPLPGGRGSEESNEFIEISVSDNGPGIPKSALDKIFQPFFTTKPTGQGTGLGLSLSYDIVKAHGGELKVETKEGEGTIFTIQLPMS